MSTLTKVFVVLLVVFSIAFTMMTVSMVARTAPWKELADRYESHARSADANLRNLIAANAAELASLRDTIKAQRESVADLERTVQELQIAKGTVERELDRASAETSDAQATYRGLLAQLQVAEAERREYKDQRNGLENNNIELTRRNIDLSERVNEQTARLAVLLAEKRQFEQQINILREENETLAQKTRTLSTGMRLEEASGAAMAGVSALTPVAGTPVRGKVLEVSGNLVTISVGSADGVKKDMVFVIHRDGAYVADLKISVVDPNQAAGRIVQEEAAPVPGDQVTDALRLGARRG